MPAPHTDTLPELLALSHRLESEESYAELEGVLRQITAIAPRTTEHGIRLGWILLTNGRNADAVDIFYQLKASTPTERANIAFGSGVGAYRSGDLTRAIKNLTFAVRGGILAANAPLLEALNAAGDFQKALAISEGMSGAAPADRDAIMTHARQLAYMQRYDDAGAAIVRMFQTRAPDGPALEFLSQILVAAKNYPAAQNVLQQLLRRSFEHADMHALWSHCLHVGYSLNEASEILQSLIDRDPAHCAALYQKALLIERSGNIEEAGRLIIRCAELQPSSPLLDGLRGRLELLQGNVSIASDFLQKVWRTSAAEIGAQQQASRPTSAIRSPDVGINPVIYMPVEINSRELLSRLLMARLAAREGFTSVILGHTVMRRGAYLPPGFVLNKSLHAMDEGLVTESRKSGHIFCAIDEEAFGWGGSIYSLTRALSPKLLDYCAALYAPGARYVAEVGKAYPSFANSLICAGNPRIDLYQARFSKFFAAETDNLRKAHGPFLLICTNFGGWNSRALSYPVVCATALKISDASMASERGAWLLGTYQDSAGAECHNTAAVIAAIPALAARFPTHKVVLRPHPGESAEYWERLLAGQPTVVVDNSPSLQSQMAAADVVIHLAGCGTGLEALLAGRPAICFNPVADFEYPKLGISGSLSPNVSNVEGLLRDVAEIVSRPPDMHIKAQVEQVAFSAHVQISDGLASQNIVSHMAGLYRERNPGRNCAPQANALFARTLHAGLVAAKRRADAHAFGHIGLQTKRLTATKQNIIDTLADLGSCLDISDQVTVDEPISGIFVIHP